MKARTRAIVIAACIPLAALIAVGAQWARTRRPPAAHVIDVAVDGPGLDATEIERTITVPLERAMPAPGVRRVMSASATGRSVVRLTLDDKVDRHAARMELTNRLAGVQLPPGASSSIAPDSDDTLHFAIEAEVGANPFAVRTAADWIVRRALMQIPGVADVDVCGGFEKRIDVFVDLDRARASRVSLADIASALGRPPSPEPFAAFASLDQIRSVVVSERNQIPIRVQDVANVSVGTAPRTCVATHGEKDEVVLATVLVRNADVQAVGPLIAARLKALENEARARFLPLDFGADAVATKHARDDVLMVRTPGETFEPSDSLAASMKSVAGIREIWMRRATPSLYQPRGEVPGTDGRDAIELILETDPNERAFADIAHGVFSALAQRHMPSDVTSFSRALPDLRSSRVRVFGPDLDALRRISDKTRDVLGHVDGVAGTWSIGGLTEPRVDVTPDRDAAARYGISAADIALAVEVSIAGRRVAELKEAEKRFDVVLGMVAPPGEKSVTSFALSRLTLSTPDGAAVPFGQVAKREERVAPPLVLREDGSRYVEVRFSIDGRSRSDALEDAKRKLAAEVTLPPGYRLSFDEEEW